MNLISLTLNNIRSHVTSTIIFTDSMLLVGDIGSGKSTILQAIEFALFGIQRSFNDANHLLRIGEDRGSVELKLNLDGKELLIKRGLKKTKTSVQQDTGFLSFNSSDEFLSPTELTARISELLAYPDKPSSIFRYSVYSSQENMKQIIQDKPDKRINVLRTIFNIDKYKQIIDNIKFILRVLNKRISFFEGKVFDLTDKKMILVDLKIDISNLQSELKLNIELLADLNKDLFNLKSDFEEKEASYNLFKSITKEKIMVQDNIEFKLTEVSKLKSDLDSLKSEINSLNNDLLKIKIPEIDFNKEFLLSDISNLESLISRNKVLKEKLMTKQLLLSDRINSINISDISSLKGQIVSVSEELDFKELRFSKVETLLRKKPELEEKILVKERELSVNKLLRSQIEKQISDLKSLSSCTTCYQEVSSEHKDKIINDLNLKLDKINLISSADSLVVLKNELNDFSKLESEKISIIKDRSYLKSELDVLKNKESDLNLKLLDLDSLKSELSSVESKLKIISTFDFKVEDLKLQDLKSKLDFLNDIELKKQKKDSLLELIDSKNEELNRLELRFKEFNTYISEQQSSLDNLNKQILDFDDIESKYLDSKTKLDDFKVKISNLDHLVTKLKTQLSMQEIQDSALSSEIAAIEKDKLRVDWYKSLVNWLKSFYLPLLDEIEKHVLAQIHYEFNSVFQKWFNLLLEDETITGEVDSQFTPKIYQNAYDLDYDSLSGGERTSVALAYRLALNKIVNQIIGLKTRDLLILDEPTEGFSTEQLDRVKDVLDELGIPQLIIVSHEMKVESFVNKTLKIEKKNNESSIIELSS